MSKFDYKKEVMDSFKDGAIITSVTLGVFFGMKFLLKTQPPTAKLDGMDILKLFGGIALGCLAKDYAIYKKWIDE